MNEIDATAYIFTAYGIGAVVVLWLIITSWQRYRHTKSALQALAHHDET